MTWLVLEHFGLLYDENFVLLLLLYQCPGSLWGWRRDFTLQCSGSSVAHGRTHHGTRFHSIVALLVQETDNDLTLVSGLLDTFPPHDNFAELFSLLIEVTGKKFFPRSQKRIAYLEKKISLKQIRVIMSQFFKMESQTKLGKTLRNTRHRSRRL